jgi:ABC-type branched-subunit amino acid transport system substrate-binding protein
VHNPSAPRRRLLAFAAVAALLAGCGSQVPPSEVVNANGYGPASNVADAATGTAGPGAGTVGGGSQGGTGVVSGAGARGGTTGGGTSVHGSSRSGTTGGGSGGGTVNQGGGSQGGGGNQASAASCAGFTNTTGITNSTITIANSADISGPVPGLFKAVQQATQAYAAYFNATSSICGRKLSVEPLDTATSDSGDQQAATTACGNAFAMVGSMSAFDDGGASTVTSCGIPDLRVTMVNTARFKSPVSYGTYSLNPSLVHMGVWDYFKGAKFGDAIKHAGFIYLDAGAAPLNEKSFKSAMQKDGYNFVMEEPMEVTNPNYDNLVAEMKQRGVKLLTYLGADLPYASTLRSKMVAQGIQSVFVLDPTAYDPAYAGVDGANGTYVYVPGPLFEETDIGELNLYRQWLARVAPNANPTYFGVYAWAAARLFTQEALALGGKLTRAALIAAVRNEHAYTDDGMFKPTDVGGKVTPTCEHVVQMQNGKWVDQTGYICGKLINSGIGG